MDIISSPLWDLLISWLFPSDTLLISLFSFGNCMRKKREQFFFLSSSSTFLSKSLFSNLEQLFPPIRRYNIHEQKKLWKLYSKKRKIFSSHSQYKKILLLFQTQNERRTKKDDKAPPTSWKPRETCTDNATTWRRVQGTSGEDRLRDDLSRHKVKDYTEFPSKIRGEEGESGLPAERKWIPFFFVW